MKTNLILPILCSLGIACGKSGGKDTTAVLSATDYSFAEGTAANTIAELTLTLASPASTTINIPYATVEGTAKAGEDFIALSNQTVSFQPGDKTKKITVTLLADDLREPDEFFQIRLQETAGVTLLKSLINITITNDDTRIGFSNTGYEAATSYPGYHLAWSDEFDGPSLSTSSWSYESGDGCPGLCGWGNNELQYYTAPPNNLFFQEGKLIIEARAESFGGKNYTSSRIKTQGKQSFKYGRIDIRAILPKGNGIWPAFWMLPQDNVYGGWPTSGEIDIMELVGSTPSKASATLHFGPGPGSIYFSRSYTLSAGTFNDQFHVFSMEWKEDLLQLYVDDNLYSTITRADLGSNTYPFNEAFYFLINLAVGGNLPGPPDASTIFPQWLIVDYVRVYQQ